MKALNGIFNQFNRDLNVILNNFMTVDLLQVKLLLADYYQLYNAEIYMFVAMREDEDAAYFQP